MEVSVIVKQRSKTMVSAVLLMMILLMIISPAAALSVREENYQKVQDSFALIEQLNGTGMTSAEFMKTVWPEVYAKISPEYQKKLAEIPHAWELTNGDTSRGGLLLTSSMDSPEKKQERLLLIDALSDLDITGLEYTAITEPEFYQRMPEVGRLSIAAEVRPNKVPPEHSIREGETQWFSANISANITLLTIRLWWENPPENENNLSITAYSPDHGVFGPFTNATSFADTRKILLETTISRENGIAEGEWWYCVQGVKVNDSQTYTL